MKVEQVDHIHVAVKDMDKAVNLFEDLLGIKFSKEFVSRRNRANSSHLCGQRNCQVRGTQRRRSARCILESP